MQLKLGTSRVEESGGWVGECSLSGSQSLHSGDTLPGFVIKNDVTWCSLHFPQKHQLLKQAVRHAERYLLAGIKTFL